MSLQQWMSQQKIQAVWVPSADAHLNEYALPHSKRREQLTGFTGSAGDALVTLETTYLFVDSRYHTQVDLEVDLTRVTPVKLDAPQAKTVLECLELCMAAHGPGFVLAADPTTLTREQAQQFEQMLLKGQGQLQAHSLVFLDSPVQPQPVWALAEQAVGQSVAQRIRVVQQWLAQQQADWLPLLKLDQIAWLLLLRGSDVAYNPVFMAHVLVGTQTVVLFCHLDQLTHQAKEHLQAANVILQPYEALSAVILHDIKPQQHVVLSKTHHHWQWQHWVEQQQAVVLEVAARHIPTEQCKAVKTRTELEGMRWAGRQASLGLQQALAWLRAQPCQAVTEASFARQLEQCYSAQEGYQGLSFNTIAGYGPHGAIVHYGTPSEDTVLQSGGLFLVDSGCQFYTPTHMGTTDCTRTVLMGTQANAEQKKNYTRVLKAHMACAVQVFPAGTTGAQLDGITRAPLWQAGLDYGHGTGHGVGAFLNVHEGPCGIHKRADVSLEAGMVVSIEPGHYAQEGIRLENLAAVVPADPNQYPPGWLCFELLAWVPFDTALIDDTLLTEVEKAWLTNYHTRCQALLNTVE